MNHTMRMAIDKVHELEAVLARRFGERSANTDVLSWGRAKGGKFKLGLLKDGSRGAKPLDECGPAQITGGLNAFPALVGRLIESEKEANAAYRALEESMKVASASLSRIKENDDGPEVEALEGESDQQPRPHDGVPGEDEEARGRS